MKSDTKQWRKLAMALVVVGLMIPAATALGIGRGNPNPRILPINSSAYGLPCGEWSGQWWQWAYSFPLAESPVNDPTGELAGLGQSGPVWFLAGTFGNASAERTVTIPAGKALFFPIIDTVWVNLPDYGDNPWSDEQRAYARSVIAPSIDDAFDLTCQIDGVEVANISDYRCQTPDGAEYMVTLPDLDNPFGIPAGTYGPCVDDGIYLMLAPLPAGQHTRRTLAGRCSHTLLPALPSVRRGHASVPVLPGSLACASIASTEFETPHPARASWRVARGSDSVPRAICHVREARRHASRSAARLASCGPRSSAAGAPNRRPAE